MSKFIEFVNAMFKIGTPQCALLTGFVAFIAGLLLLFVGFFRTLLVAVVVTVGVFLGGVSNKKEAVSSFINQLFPPKDGQIPHHDDE